MYSINYSKNGQVTYPICVKSVRILFKLVNIRDYIQKWSYVFFVDLSLPDTADQMQVKIAEILSAFQTGALIHCGMKLRNGEVKCEIFDFSLDLDKNYNDKLCLEYKLNVSPEHLTTTDECISVALREISRVLFSFFNRHEELLANSILSFFRS